MYTTKKFSYLILPKSSVVQWQAETLPLTNFLYVNRYLYIKKKLLTGSKQKGNKWHFNFIIIIMHNFKKKLLIS